MQYYEVRGVFPCGHKHKSVELARKCLQKNRHLDCDETGFHIIRITTVGIGQEEKEVF